VTAGAISGRGFHYFNGLRRLFRARRPDRNRARLKNTSNTLLPPPRPPALRRALRTENHGSARLARKCRFFRIGLASIRRRQHVVAFSRDPRSQMLNRRSNPFPSSLGKVARSAGWGLAGCYIGLHDRHGKPASIHTCFPHPIRRCAAPSPLRGEGRPAGRLDLRECRRA